MPMIRFLAVFISAGLLGVFLLVKLLGGNDGPAVVPMQINLAPKQVDTTLSDARAERAKKVEQQVRARFQDAPQDVISLATNIANPDISLASYSNDIAQLSAEEINQTWGQTHPETHPEFTHNLLREAILAGNTGAAALLLDGGASVAYNDNEMPFQVSSLVFGKAEQNLWFPDYRTGSKFLRMWLDRGGDPNITHSLYGNGNGTLLSHIPIYNLESTLALLDAGADPWAPFEVKTADGKFLYEQPSYFMTLATANKIQAEVSFRIALEGHYKNGPEDQLTVLNRTYERLAAQYLDPQTSNEEKTAWTLHKSLQVIYAESGMKAGPNVRSLISRRFDPQVGGFFLGPNDLRSPDTFDQRVANRDGQFGTNKWLSQN